MDIQEQFNLIAEEYDQNRRKFIPCFDDYYENTTKLILASIPAPKRVLDLGAGTGLLTSFWYQQCPEAEYVLVDIADDMLQVARRRFAGVDTVSCKGMDYNQKLPAGDFDSIISALSIHHLEDDQKKELFARIYGKLPAGGLFVNYDQFCVGQEGMDRWFDAYWTRQVEASGLTETDLSLWRERVKLDRECSLEEELAMLKQCGFRGVKCLYSYHKFSVIAAIK